MGWGAEPRASVAKGQCRVLTALIGVVDGFLRGSLLGGHLQGRKHKLGTQVSFHRPADDPPAERVEHNRKVQEAGPGRHTQKFLSSVM